MSALYLNTLYLNTYIYFGSGSSLEAAMFLQ